MRQVAFCTWCRTEWPVESAEEADEWLRTHPCPSAVKDFIPDEENPR
jgi:hypothetical protein